MRILRDCNSRIDRAGNVDSGDVLSDDPQTAARFLFGDQLLHMASLPFMRAMDAVWLCGSSGRQRQRAGAGPGLVARTQRLQWRG